MRSYPEPSRTFRRHFLAKSSFKPTWTLSGTFPATSAGLLLFPNGLELFWKSSPEPSFGTMRRTSRKPYALCSFPKHSQRLVPTESSVVQSIYLYNFRRRTSLLNSKLYISSFFSVTGICFKILGMIAVYTVLCLSSSTRFLYKNDTVDHRGSTNTGYQNYIYIYSLYFIVSSSESQMDSSTCTYMFVISINSLVDALHLSSSIFGGMIFDRKIVQAVLLSVFHPALLYQVIVKGLM